MYVFKIMYVHARAWLPTNVLREEARGGENARLTGTSFSLKPEAVRMTIRNLGRR